MKPEYTASNRPSNTVGESEPVILCCNAAADGDNLPKRQPCLWNGFSRERITCADGFNISVQASSGHYCEPRNNTGPYTMVELGFPSEAPSAEVLDHAEMCGTDDPCKTVYPYVLADAVMRLLAEHGGMVSGDLPPLDVPAAFMMDGPTPSLPPSPCPRLKEIFATLKALRKEVLDIIQPLVDGDEDPLWWDFQSHLGALLGDIEDADIRAAKADYLFAPAPLSAATAPSETNLNP